jgi:hypothetical protein
MNKPVRVYVITYRRPKLLLRSLHSLLAQSYPGWVAEVLNDDPEDHKVDEIIRDLGDPRIHLSDPPMRRGGTGNFNYAFRTVAEPLASILEDDNWWEPDFLRTMVAALETRPEVSVACGNERIWVEQPDLSWLNTGSTIWPKDQADRLVHWNAMDKCGGARLCNSSLLFRTQGSEQWQTPSEIPIDVTEHFRERVVPHPILLVSAPLVNYAQTLESHRSGGRRWKQYQLLLVGSVFALTPPAHRPFQARVLWKRARCSDRPFGSTLLATGMFVTEAKELWRQGLWSEKIRFVGGQFKRPGDFIALRESIRRNKASWDWLLQGPFAEFMRGRPFK